MKHLKIKRNVFVLILILAICFAHDTINNILKATAFYCGLVVIDDLVLYGIVILTIGDIKIKNKAFIFMEAFVGRPRDVRLLADHFLWNVGERSPLVHKPFQERPGSLSVLQGRGS